jgi:hypothetical protein
MIHDSDGHDQPWLGGARAKGAALAKSGCQEACPKGATRNRTDPASFDELNVVPLELTFSPGVAVRKAKLIHRKHDYRILFLHRRSDGGSEHVDLLYILKRKEGYHIDWEWIASVLGE